MPPPRKTDVWRSKTYVNGYVENRDGYARMRYRGRGKAAGLRWTEENKTEALRLLDQWISRQRSGEEVKGRTPTAHEAFADYWSVYKASWSEIAKKEVKAAFATFFPTDMRLKDITPSYITARIEAAALAPGTIAARFRRCKRFVQYCVESGWAKRNEFSRTPTPAQPKKKIVRTYSDQEFKAIMGWFADRDPHGNGVTHRARVNLQQYPLLWRLLASTAMRIGEALALWWEEDCPDVATESIVTARSIVLRNTKTDVDRVFPLQGDAVQIARVREVVDQLREYRTVNRGRVLPWRDATTVALMLGNALDSLGIERPARQVHVFRATCEAQWEREHVPPIVAVDLAGHSLRVYEKHYRRRPTSEDLSRALEGVARGTALPENDASADNQRTEKRPNKGRAR